MRRRLPLAILLVAAIAGATTIAAQEPTAAPPGIVKIGEYRQFDWLRKIKLGVARFVNPTLFDHAAISYKYNPEQIIGSIDPSKLQSLFMTGELAIVELTPSQYYQISLPENDEWVGEFYNNPSIELIQEQKPGNYYFLSDSQSLFGVEPSDTLVSWNAVSPVVVDVGAISPK